MMAMMARAGGDELYDGDDYDGSSSDDTDYDYDKHCDEWLANRPSSS